MAALELEFGPRTLAAIQALTDALNGQQLRAAGPDEAEELLSRKEAAKFLGVSLTTLDNWARAGDIPRGFELSPRNLRWRKADLVAFARKRSEAA